MSRTKQMMAYSAISEDQVMARFDADAARLERQGYVPVSQSWDATTLTVTYALSEGPTRGAVDATADPDGGTRPRSNLARRLRLSFGF